MMNHEHLNFDGWRRLVEELLKGKVRRWLDLLRCPECRRRLRQLLALREPQAEQQVSSWDEIRDHFRMELARASEDAARAEGVLRKFLDASDLQRNLWLTNSSLRGNLALCQKVLRRANEEVKNSPDRARKLAMLGLELAECVEDEPKYKTRLWEDCKAEAWLVLSRVHGRLGDLERARQTLGRASEHQECGSCDPLVLGRLLQVEASSLGQRGLFDTASLKLNDAIIHYRSIGEREEEGWCRMGFAHLNVQADRPTRAIWHLRKTRQFLGDGVQPRHELYLRHNEIASLCFLHEFSMASRLLNASRAFYEEFPESEVQVRVPWLSGKISAGFLRFDEARSHYEHSRRLILETWGDLDGALLSLEFGQLYAELGKPRQATRLLEQALPVLKARSFPQVSKAEELLAEAARRARDRHTPTN